MRRRVLMVVLALLCVAGARPEADTRVDAGDWYVKRAHELETELFRMGAFRDRAIRRPDGSVLEGRIVLPDELGYPRIYRRGLKYRADGSAFFFTTRSVCAAGCTVTNSAANLQAQIDAMVGGDETLVEKDFNYVGRFILRHNGTTSMMTLKTGVTSTGALTPASDYPAANVRATIAAHAANMASLQAPSANESVIMTVEPGDTGTHCAAAPCIASYWTVQFLEFRSEAGGYNGGNLGEFGSSRTASDLFDGGSDVQNLKSEIPTNIIIDRTLWVGDTLRGQHRGVVLSCRNCELKNSYLFNAGLTGTHDGQSVLVLNTDGPVSVTNNWLNSGTEMSMTGGDISRCKQTVTVSASPAPTASVFTVSSVLDLDTDIEKWIEVIISGNGEMAQVQSVSGNQITLKPGKALPSAPVAGANVTWSCNPKDVVFRYNHYARDPATRGDIVAMPTGLTETEVAGGSLASGVPRYYKLVAKRSINRGDAPRSAASSEVTCNPTGANLTCRLSWSAVANVTAATVGHYYAYAGTTSGAQDRRFRMDAPTLTLDDTGTDPRYLVNNAGGYGIGAQTITVDGGTGGLRGGDQIKFSGHATVYTLDSSNNAVTTTSITLDSPLTAAIVDNEVISTPVPTTGGPDWSVKNNVEFKNCVRCTFEYNVVEYIWTSGQYGMSFLASSVSQEDGDESAVVSLLTVRYNEFAHMNGAISISISNTDFAYRSGTSEVQAYTHNLFTDCNASWGGDLNYDIIIGGGENSGINYQNFDGLTVDHNTFICNDNGIALIDMYKSSAQRTLVSPLWRNNIGRRGVNGFRALVPYFENEGTTSWNTVVSGTPVWTKNAFADLTCANYPDAANNFCSSEALWQLNFVSYATGNYAVASSSTWKNAGTDGLDLGACISCITTGTAIARSGDNSGGAPPPPPPPPPSTTALYNWAKNAQLDSTLNLLTRNIRVMLVGPTYVFNPDHSFIDMGGASDPVDARITGTTDQTLSARTITLDTTNDFAYFDAGDVSFSAVPGGQSVVGIILYDDTGVGTTSRLIGYMTVVYTTTGSPVQIQWPTPATGGILVVRELN